MNFFDVVTLASTLVEYKSITPNEAGCLEALHHALCASGWTSHLVQEKDTTNLYARYGTGTPHVCFAGHVDVVPPGPEALWTFPPFVPTIHEGKLFGRGIADMKGAIACFLTALFGLQAHAMTGSCSILLTSDEEGDGTHGIPFMIPWLKEKDERPDVFLIGEPTGTVVGDVLQVGRRGSMTGILTVEGKQGHIAYPHLARNPLPPMVHCAKRLLSHSWDQGTAYFEPSRLEITSIDSCNPVMNMTPYQAQMRFGLRFNPLHHPLRLSEQIGSLCAETIPPCKHHLQVQLRGDPFFTENAQWVGYGKDVLEKVTGKTPTCITTGGTTDGRFLHKLAPVIEIGLPDTTIHQTDEHVALQDLWLLKDIYQIFLSVIFSKA